MQNKTLKELEEEYELELDKIIKKIKKDKCKNVLLQFPDGIKPYAAIIVDELERNLPKVKFFIWLGSCYGACDTPNVKDFGIKIDLLVQFGHSKNL